MNGDSQRARGAFVNSTDPRYFIAFSTHERVLAAMIDGINSGCRLQVLVAPAGLGKTMVLQRLAQSLPRLRHRFYQFLIPCSVGDFYRFAIDDFGGHSKDLPDGELRSRFATLLSQRVNESHGVLLFFDEAQAYLSREMLTELLQLLELCDGPVHIIVCGQPKLLDMLQMGKAEDASKKLELWHSLSPLTVDESIRYISVRARLAGYSESFFPEETLFEIARESDGVPLVINNLCWQKLSEHRGRDWFGTPGISFTESPCENMCPESRATEQQERTLDSQVPAPPYEIVSSVETLMRDVVSWRGTAGELVGATTSIPVSVRAEELLDSLSSERDELARRGISLDVRHREGLPSLISLRRLTADDKSDDRMDLTVADDPAYSGLQIPPRAEPKTERLRWRALYGWLAGLGISVAVAAGMMRTAETRILRANLPAAPHRTAAHESSSGDSVMRTPSPSPSANGSSTAGKLAELRLDEPRAPEQHADAEELRQAALTGDPALQYRAAIAFEQIDKVEAYKWLVLSHAAGYEKSLVEIQRLTPQFSSREIGKVRYEVARAYLSGQGSRMDLVQGYRWMALAKASGVPVDDELRSLSQRMSPEQIASASRDAQNWLGRGLSARETTAFRFDRSIQR